MNKKSQITVLGLWPGRLYVVISESKIQYVVLTRIKILLSFSLILTFFICIHLKIKGLESRIFRKIKCCRENDLGGISPDNPPDYPLDNPWDNPLYYPVDILPGNPVGNRVGYSVVYSPDYSVDYGVDYSKDYSRYYPLSYSGVYSGSYKAD